MPRRLLNAIWVWCAMIGAEMLIGSGRCSLQAQPPVSPAPASGGVTSVQTQTYWLEYGLVLLMFGIALYSVCRSSRRN